MAGPKYMPALLKHLKVYITVPVAATTLKQCTERGNCAAAYQNDSAPYSLNVQPGTHYSRTVISQDDRITALPSPTAAWFLKTG